MYAIAAVPKFSALADQVSVSIGERGGVPLFFLLMASTLLIFQASWDCTDGDGSCTGMQGFAVAIGVISFVGSIMILFGGAVAEYKPHLGLFLIICWFTAVGTLTFTYKDESDSGLYGQVSNGFFSCWIGLFASFLVTFASYSPSTEPTDESNNMFKYYCLMLLGGFYQMWAAWNVCANSTCEDEEAVALSTPHPHPHPQPHPHPES